MGDGKTDLRDILNSINTGTPLLLPQTRGPGGRFQPNIRPRGEGNEHLKRFKSFQEYINYIESLSRKNKGDAAKIRKELEFLRDFLKNRLEQDGMKTTIIGLNKSIKATKDALLKVLNKYKDTEFNEPNLFSGSQPEEKKEKKEKEKKKKKKNVEKEN